MNYKEICYNIMIGIIMFVLPVMCMQYLMDYHQHMVDLEVSLCKRTCDERIKRLTTDIVEGLGEMAWHELH